MQPGYSLVFPILFCISSFCGKLYIEMYTMTRRHFLVENSQKDFFISYNHADLDWGDWIAKQLEEAGYTTIIQAWDFRPGENFILNMQEATSKSKQTIAV